MQLGVFSVTAPTVLFTPENATEDIPLCFTYGLAHKSVKETSNGLNEFNNLQRIALLDPTLTPHVYSANERSIWLDSFPAVTYHWIAQNLMETSIPDIFKEAIICSAALKGLKSYTYLDKFGIDHDDISPYNVLLLLDTAELKLIDFDTMPHIRKQLNETRFKSMLRSYFRYDLRDFGITEYSVAIFEERLRDIFGYEMSDADIERQIAYYLRIAYLNQKISARSFRYPHLSIGEKEICRIWEAAYPLIVSSHV